MRLKILLFALILGSACSCDFINGKITETPQNTTPIAKMGDKVLYMYDLQGIIPANTSAPDSQRIVQSFIDDWVRAQIIVQEAEKIVPLQNQDFDYAIEKYRESLLTHALEENLVATNIDSSVSEQEIQGFFAQNRTQFELQSPIAKGKTVRILKKIPNQNTISSNINAKDNKNLAILEDYCVQNGADYNFNDNSWSSLDELLQALPADLQKKLPTGAINTQVSDSLYNYYVYINSYKSAGEASPIEFEHENIRDIIFLKRKQLFLNKYYQDLYNKAVSDKKFEILQPK